MGLSHWTAFVAGIASVAVPVTVRARRVRRRGNRSGHRSGYRRLEEILGFTERDFFANVAVAVEFGSKPFLVYLFARIAISMLSHGNRCALLVTSSTIAKTASNVPVDVAQSLVDVAVRKSFESTTADIFEARTATVRGLREVIAAAPLVLIALVVVHLVRSRPDPSRRRENAVNSRPGRV